MPFSYILCKLCKHVRCTILYQYDQVHQEKSSKRSVKGRDTNVFSKCLEFFPWTVCIDVIKFGYSLLYKSLCMEIAWNNIQNLSVFIARKFNIPACNTFSPSYLIILMFRTWEKYLWQILTQNLKNFSWAQYLHRSQCPLDPRKST